MKELKAHRLAREIRETASELRHHQSLCKHPKSTKEHRSNTGNYDRSLDKYWTEFDCPTCLKKWSENGSV